MTTCLDFLCASSGVRARTLTGPCHRGLRRQKSKHSPGSVKVKATTARQSWCTAVNNHGGFGRWGYVEITDPRHQARTR